MEDVHSTCIFTRLHKAFFYKLGKLYSWATDLSERATYTLSTFSLKKFINDFIF